MDSSERIALIRRMKPEDSEDISRIYRTITKQPANIDFATHIAELVHGKDTTCLIAEQGGRIVGFMISYVLTLGFGVEKGAWIATFAVHPRYMGQGIGALLAEETFKVYRDQGITSVFTSVKWDSTDLLSFFRRLDFQRSDFINLGKKLS